MSGKGSSPRPFSVDAETFASNWERVFGKKAKQFTVTVPEPLQMRASIDGNAGGSNPPQVGSTPTPAAIYIDNATGA